MRPLTHIFQQMNMNTKVKGFFYGIITSVTFGLIPLFTLPLMQKGMQSDSILFYRFVGATLALGTMMLIKKNHSESACATCRYLSYFHFSIPARRCSCFTATRLWVLKRSYHAAFYVSGFRYAADAVFVSGKNVMGNVDGCGVCGRRSG